ncbi:MAG: hypothetical protein IT350_04820 [Deltaproteobacteria bacterium]|nr:hypothetical protein [Deltaproteobacteria bacterium]
MIVGQVFMPASTPRGTVLIAHGLPSGAERAATDDPGYPGLARTISDALGVAAVIFNVRGPGASGGQLEVDRGPGDLAAVIDTWERAPWRADPLIGVGSSTGGSAMIVQSARDARLRHVVTFAAPGDFSFLDAVSAPEAWFDLYRRLGMIREGYAKSPREWAESFVRLCAFDAVSRCRAETLTILHGEDDEVVPLAHARRLAEAAPRARLEILPGVTHRMRRDPRAVDALLRRIDALLTPIRET